MTEQESNDKSEIKQPEKPEASVVEKSQPETGDHDPAPAQASVEGAVAEHVDDDVLSELAAAHEEIAKLKDAFLRAKAEEDNIRRRAEKEVANSRKFAVEGFAKEMLNVYDSLKLAVAVEVADDADDVIKGVHDGVSITLKQLHSAFTKFSLTEIMPEVGDKLDPNLHQAMSMIESQEVKAGCILNVIQAGFQLHDRLLRPAMVVVAK